MRKFIKTKFKMKKLVAVLTLVTLLASCQEQKIGFIDNGKVINDFQKKIDLEAKYKLKGEAFDKKRDSISQAYNIDAKSTEMKLARLSQAKQQEGLQEFRQKWQIVQQQLQFEEEQISKSFNSEIDSVLTTVKEFVKDYGKQNGYTFILGKNEAGSVMYGEESKDLTKAITDALNKEYKK